MMGSDRDNFQTINTPSSYSTCPGLIIKWNKKNQKTWKCHKYDNDSGLSVRIASQIPRELFNACHVTGMKRDNRS